MKAFRLFGLILLVMLTMASSSWAVTRIMDGALATALGVTSVTSDHQIGSGAWQNVADGAKLEFGMPAASVFPGSPVTVSQISRIEYWTKNGVINNPTGLDFYFVIYTVGNAHNWYGERLTSEPMYYNDLNRSATEWNHWNTDAGTNQMTWFDSNHSAYGYANAPTLADLQAGPINWALYPGGSGTIDYRNMSILRFDIQTGSGWNNSFDGIVDNIVITLTDGRTLVVDLEQNPGPVHNITQYCSYTTIDAAASNASSNDVIEVDPGTYPEGIVTINVNLTIRASNLLADRPLITPTTNTGGSDDARGWFLVTSGVSADFQHLAFDGNGKNIHTAIRHNGPGHIDDCSFANIFYQQYVALGIQSLGDNPFLVENCYFSNIERVGCHFNDPTTSPKIFRNNVFVGKGDGDNLNYGFECERGANVLVENNVISNCTGVALSDGSGSAGIYGTTYFYSPSYTTLAAHGNVLPNNSVGVYFGYTHPVYAPHDYTIGTATSNNLEGSVDGVYSESDNLAQATANWWGDVNGPSSVSFLSVANRPQPFGENDSPVQQRNSLDGDVHGLVHYSPWVASNGYDYNGGLEGWQPDLTAVGVSTNGTIQEGVDLVSGSTVYVAAGTYYESQIVLNSAITLQGAGAATSIIDGGNGTGLAVAGTILITATDGDVTVDGFTLQHPSKSADYAAVHAYGSPSGVTYTLSHCIIHGTNNPSDTEQKDFGIYFHGNLGSCVASYVTIDQTNWNAILIETNPGPTDVNNCTWDRGIANTSNDGYFNMNYGGADVTSLQKVDHNTVNMGNDAGPYDNDHRGFAITFAGGAFNDRVGGYTSVQITNNTITNLKGYRRGIGLYNNAVSGPNGDIVGAVITGNTITGASLTGTQGIRELGQNTSTITGNSINNVGTAYQGQTWNGHSPVGTVLNLNNLANNTLGAVWPGLVTLNATCNWWGTLNYANILAKTTGTVNVDPWNDATLANCTYTDLNTYDFTLSYDDPYVGCAGGPSCTSAILKVAFDRVNFVGGHLVLTLPAGVVANWSGNYQIMPPLANRSTNLNFMNAAGGGTGTITLDVSWQPPYSTGTLGQYIAWLPVINTATNGGVVAVSSYDYWDANTDHYTSGLDFALPELYVDCTAPTATLSGGAGQSGCDAYSSDAEFANQLMASFDNSGTPASDLASAQIVLTNGSGTFTYSVPTAGGTWPSTTVWTDMAEGCNTFSLTVTDAACNTSAPSSVVVEKDSQGPVAAQVYAQSACYNDIIGDPQYGATLLDANLDLDIADVDLCGDASTFDLSFSITVANTQTVSYSDLAAMGDFPDADRALTLWNAIVAAIGNSSYSGSVTVNWTATDCAGNATAGSFDINCVDFAPPTNSFDVFDARPSSDGVWLKWAWSTTDAVEAKIFRKGEGDTPVYAGNLWSADANYEKAFAAASLPANGWTEVATIAGGQSSADFSGTHGGPLNDYWMDNVDAPRDIYRYITFVKDAAGNWSQVESYTIGDDADRSTNYWLGDFPDAGSPGIVNTADLSELSTGYFASVPPAGDVLDIGAENEENGVGKGIPDPDQLINFLDLIPFSFNFGVVMNGGFNVQTPRANPAGTDAAPVVTVARANQNLLEVGSEFDVIVSLSGNSNSAVKDVEAQLTFDPQVLELVSVSSNAGEVYDGIPWSIAKAIPGSNDRIGIASAAMGEIASFVGDFPMATITFRWIADRVPETSMQLESYQVVDVFGHSSEGEGPAITFGATGAIPTTYALYQNYPNPFNPSTTIRVDLPEAADVQLVIYNVMGQEVRTLVSGMLPAGAHSLNWNGLDNSGRPVGTGMYIYRVSAGPLHDIKKMLLTR